MIRSGLLKGLAGAALWVSVGITTAAGEDLVSLQDMTPAQLRAFLKGVDGDWRMDTKQARGLPPPPPRSIPDDAVRHALIPPDKLDPPTTSLAQAISERRSRRSFDSQPVSLETMSFLLWQTQGVTGYAGDPDDTSVPLRAAPSAGARYPLETYVFVQSVDELQPGLYHYDVSAHELVEISLDEALRAALARACFGEQFIYDAAAVIVFTAVPARTEWRYGPIAHRMIAYETGHAAQNLLLAAQASGLNACPVAAYHQPTLDQLMGVDGEHEFSLYLVALGWPPGKAP